MHPAFSVIFFTVLSGMGYGLYMVMLPALANTRMSGEAAAGALVVALALVTLGLVSSLGHLANPKNAWRAFSRFRTSWLSREGALAVAFYPPALAQLALLYQAGPLPAGAVSGIWWSLLSALGFILALATVFSTGMIYACLKTIRQWHTPLVPANYVALAFTSGMLLFVAMTTWVGLQPGFGQIAMTLTLISVGLALKWIYYFWIGKPHGSTINTATGFHRAQVRLLDVGYTSGNFLTEEFGFRIDAARTRLLRFVVLGLTFAVPLLLVTLMLVAPSPVTATLALISNATGTLIERWLFFAEARHVVNLYHGAQHT